MSHLRRSIYRIGTAFRNRLIQPRLEFLLGSESWERERLESRQLSLVQELIQWASIHSPHYRDKFGRAGISATDIRSLKHMELIPPLEKDELLSNRESIQIKPAGEKLFHSETSGSTGTPLVFYRNADWDAWHNASVMRGYVWHGVSPWERNGYLWGFNLSPRQQFKTRLLDGLQNRFRMFSYAEEEIQGFAKQLRTATFLGGYSSMIYEVAKAINRSASIEPLTNLKLVRGTSEKIYDKYQKEAIQAFGRRITSEYGAAEAGIIAFECPAGSMHVNMETCIVEEDQGEILVTNLFSRSFPVIRYRLGDYIQYDPDAMCPCGRAHAIIREVTGRVGKKIYGKSQSYPSLTMYYVFKNLAQEKKLILNYQAVQDAAGALRLDLEQRLTSEERCWLEKECAKYFGDDVEVALREGVDLRSSNRKKRDFVSNIEV